MSVEGSEEIMVLDDDDDDNGDGEVLEIEEDDLPRSMTALLQLHVNIGTVRRLRHRRSNSNSYHVSTTHSRVTGPVQYRSDTEIGRGRR